MSTGGPADERADVRIGQEQRYSDGILTTKIVMNLTHGSDGSPYLVYAQHPEIMKSTLTLRGVCLRTWAIVSE